MRPPREDTLPWYKQFWPWFLISLPGSVVIAAIITINIAVTTDDGLVSDDYYKEGLAIHREAESATRAHTLGIAADLHYAADTGALSLTLDQSLTEAQAQLTLEIVHPTRPGNDQTLQLVAVDGRRYAGRAQPLIAANWKLELYPTPKVWRIVGRLLTPETANARLQSSQAPQQP